MRLNVRYNVAENVFGLESPLTGELHGFSEQGLLDFLDWLRSERHRTQRFGDFEMRIIFQDRRKVVTWLCPDGPVKEILAFGLDSYQTEVGELSAAIQDVIERVARPARRMAQEGIPYDQIISTLDRATLFDLTVVWSQQQAPRDSSDDTKSACGGDESSRLS